MPSFKHSNPVTSDLWHERLTLAIDIGIASTVLFAPLFMGGRGPVGRFVFVLCVAWTAMFWCARQCVAERARWRKSGAEWLVLAGLGVLVLQLIPLPQLILALVSPHIAELLPLWTPSADATTHLGIWNQVSLNPFATQRGLVTYIAYATLFLVVFNRLESRRDLERLLRLIALATCFLAIVGLAQFLFSNGKFLWIFEHVSRDTKSMVRGPFQNQNHFAHLLALGVGPILWWLATLPEGRHQKGPRDIRNYLQDPAAQSHVLLVALGTVAFAVLLTFSRGGVIAMLLAAIAGVGLFTWKQILPKRVLAMVAIIAALMLVALSIHGYEGLARKLVTFRDSQSIDDLSHGRWALWNAQLQAFPDFWLLGTGVGTHRDIYPTYLEEYFDVEFTHGESGYLPLLLETGVLGLGLMLVGIYSAFRWSVWPLVHSSDRATVACAAAILPGVIVSAVHSLGDFVWYIPACMTTTVLLLAAGCSLFHHCRAAEHSAPSTREVEGPNVVWGPRPAWLATSVVCLLLFVLATSTLFGPAVAAPAWYDYLRHAKAASDGIWQPTRPDEIAAIAADVEAVVAASPNDARAQAQLAGLYLQQFDIAQQDSQNPMPLSQIRDAALASKFSSKEQLDDWLDIAVGENRRLFDAALEHARRSVRRCPLQGEAYALLARLAFLEGPDADRKNSYVRQALLVRPYHSRVHFVAGQESLLNGNIDEALLHWKKAFQGEQEVRDELVRELTGVISAAELLAALDPDQRGLEALLGHYRQADDLDSAKVVAAHYVQVLTGRLSTEDTRDKLWTLKRLSMLHERLEAPDQAIHLAQQAASLAPGDFELRLRLGRMLVHAGRFEEAEAELQWCVRRKPDDAGIRKLLVNAKRGAPLRQADASTTPATLETIRE